MELQIAISSSPTGVTLQSKILNILGALPPGRRPLQAGGCGSIRKTIRNHTQKLGQIFSLQLAADSVHCAPRIEKLKASRAKSRNPPLLPPLEKGGNSWNQKKSPFFEGLRLGEPTPRIGDLGGF